MTTSIESIREVRGVLRSARRIRRSGQFRGHTCALCSPNFRAHLPTSAPSVAHRVRPTECARCDEPLDMSGALCMACNRVANSLLKRWAEGGDKNLTYREIGAELGLSMNAVTLRVTRMRRKAGAP